MAKYLLKRIVQTFVVIIMVSMLTFLLVSLLPGDPVYIYSGSTDISQEEYDNIYHKLNLDDPLPVRYVEWVSGVLHGDFGTSYRYHTPVWELIGSRIGITLYLSILAVAIGMPIGVLFGLLTAINRGKKTDTIITLIANITSCLPQFWIAMCVMLVFSLKMGLLPATGFVWPWEDFGEHIKHLIMPLFCLALGGIASTTRQTRSSMLEVMRQDYIRTARSKGVIERKVITKHMLKNGLLPIVTLVATRLAHIIGGSMFVETVFMIPGMGTLIVNCITSRDVPVLQALVMVTSGVTCIVYILTDLAYMVIDPRISLVED